MAQGDDLSGGDSLELALLTFFVDTRLYNASQFRLDAGCDIQRVKPAGSEEVAQGEVEYYRNLGELTIVHLCFEVILSNFGACFSPYHPSSSNCLHCWGMLQVCSPLHKVSFPPSPSSTDRWTICGLGNKEPQRVNGGFAISHTHMHTHTQGQSLLLVR